MSVIERFVTGCVAPPERLGFWNQIAEETFAGLRVDSTVECFDAEMWRWTLGELVMIRPRAPHSVVHRWADGKAPDSPSVMLHLLHRGRTLQTQWDREADLRAGDFTLCDSGDGYRLDLSPANEMIVVEIPRQRLLERLPNLDEVISRRIPGGAPGSRLLHDFLLSLWRQGDQSRADPLWLHGVTEVLLDLVGLAVKGSTQVPPAPNNPLEQRVKALIESQLAEPELRTAFLAEELGVSPRSIQNVFAARATTPSAYILERRLARAAERLAAEANTSITGIAFDLGFNDSAYFTRCFRQKFGVSPSEFKARA